MNFSALILHLLGDSMAGFLLNPALSAPLAHIDHSDRAYRLRCGSYDQRAVLVNGDDVVLGSGATGEKEKEKVSHGEYIPQSRQELGII